MSTIDVAAEIGIAADPSTVAAVMFDPAREPEWVGAVTAVRVIDQAMAVGARVEHQGRFLGRDLSWVTAIEAAHFPHVLALRIEEGPFVGLVRYEIQRGGPGSHVRIRNTGEPRALGPLPAPLVTGPMKTAMAEDLGRLKAIVEAA